MYYESIFVKYKHDIKKTWKTISEVLCKSNKTKSAFDEIIADGKNIQDHKEIADRFNNFFVNVGPNLASKITSNNSKPYISYLTGTNNAMFRFELTDTDKLEKILKSLRSKPSAGPDGISVILLKFLAPALVAPIAIIINQSLTTGIFPDKLKVAKVIPLYKKENRSIMTNYRPVSLLNSISKLFEKVVFEQLDRFFKENGLFFESQYGFRKLHSTEFATLELVDRALSDIDKKNTSIAIFMDLSKAFDTLDHDILLNKLSHYGIRNTELKWFSSYLHDRMQYVEINDTTSELLPLKAGVPQGSILGPLLFLIYMNDVPNSSNFFKYILYADDSTLFTTINASNVSLNINIELSKVYEWLAINKLSLNVEKTKYMIFHAINKNISQIELDFYINDEKIERVNRFNFLGIVLDENLSWKHHIDMISNKISRCVAVINRLKHFLPTNILRTLYCSMIQSHLNYAILVWGHDHSRLNKIEKRAVRVIAASKYNAHTNPIFNKLKLLKAHDLFKLSCLKFYFKYKHNEVPVYFKNYEFRSNDETHNYPTRHGDIIPANVTRTNQFQKCIRHHLPKLINETPNQILEKIWTHSFHGFSEYIKRYYIDNYPLTCTVENCYICRHS